MNNIRIALMSDEKLSEYIDHLERQNSRAAIYEELSKTPQGKFLIEDLKTDREWVRGAYASIRAEDQDVGVALNGLQAEEFYITRLIERLEQNQTMAASVAREREAVSREMERRRQKRKNDLESGSFLPGRMKGKKHDAGAGSTGS